MGVVSRIFTPSCIVALAIVSTPGLAADPPTPGQIFQQQQQPGLQPRLPEVQTPPIEEKPDAGDFTTAPRAPGQAPSATSATRRVSVKAFHLSGLTVVPEEKVQALLEPYRNRDLTLTQLHEAATVVQEYLRGTGYFIRVYVPTQDVKDGVVELRIVESRIGAIDIQRGEGLRVNDATIRRYFELQGQAAGELLQQAKIEHDLLLVNDLAGVRVRAILVPGNDPGSTTLMLNALAEPFVQGYLSADNAGNKFTGRERADADVRINSPLGIGDQISLRGSVSSHSNYARVAYTVPVTATGLAIGAAYSYNTYRLCCEFSALDQNGWAQAVNLYATYPLMRSPSRNVSVSLVYADRRIVGNALGAQISDHRDNSWTPGVYGDWQDNWTGAAARSSWSVQLATGRIDLSASPDQAADAATAGTAGRFQKTAFNLARTQRLNDQWTLLAAARGQVASKNLESSEKLFLGGISGVRAYPTGEAIGDSGFIVNVEVQREIAPQWIGSVFLDYGYIQLHQNPWANWQAGNPTIQNKYGLSGAGLGATWQPNPRVTVRAILAAPVGSNPGRDVNGRNSENARDAARLWAAVSWAF